MTPSVRASLFALAAFALFATHDVFVKILGAHYAPFQIVFFSVLLGFPLVAILLLRDATVDTLIPKHPWWTIGRTAASMIAGVSAFYAFSVLPLAQTYAILFVTPLIITVLAVPILGERVGWRRGVAVVVGLAGVLIVLNPSATELTFGHMAALSCAIFGALASIIVRRIGREERSVVLMLYPMVANFALMGALLPWVYEPMPLEHLGLSFLVALFALMAMSCLIYAYRLGSASIIAPMQYSQILWAVLYGTLFFGETPAWNTALGAAVIIASGVYIVMREASGGTSENRPVLRTRSRVATPSAPRVAPFLDDSARGPDGPISPTQDATKHGQ